MVNEFYLFDQESRLNFHPISNGLESKFGEVVYIQTVVTFGNHFYTLHISMIPFWRNITNLGQNKG